MIYLLFNDSMDKVEKFKLFGFKSQRMTWDIIFWPINRIMFDHIMKIDSWNEIIYEMLDRDESIYDAWIWFVFCVYEFVLP